MSLRKLRDLFTAEPVQRPHLRVVETPKKKKQRAKRRNFEKVYPNNARIIVIESINPKRPGSLAYERYSRYTSLMSVEEALDRGIPYSDIDSDLHRGYIKVELPK